MRPRPHIELSIEALVLDGLPPQPLLRDRLSQELVRLLSEPGALDMLLASGDAPVEISHIDAGSLAGGPRLGEQVGQALFSAVRGVAASEGTSTPDLGAQDAPEGGP